VVQGECAPGDHGMQGAIRAETAQHEKLDGHENGRAAREEKQQCVALVLVGYDDCREPEQSAKYTDWHNSYRTISTI